MARIEVCGAMASGKTTLVRALQDKGFIPLYERFEENPFFGDGVNNGVSSAFEVEIVFLLLHANLIRQHPTCSSLSISDFSLYQDWCYASINLEPRELQIFRHVYRYYESCIAQADLLIYLQCSVEILRQRIVKRARKMEQDVSAEYLQAMIHELESSLKGYSKVLFIRSDEYDFFSSNDVSRIVGKIYNGLGTVHCEGR